MIIYRCKIIIVTFALIINSLNCFAKQVTLPNTEMKYLTSKSGVDYKLYISLPEGYYDKENYSYRKKYPVLYILDGDVEFAMVKNITDTMVNFGTIEPMIIVGIGYKGQELSQYNSKIFWENYTLNRTRDYIPQELTKDVDRFMKERVDDGYQFVENHWQGEKFKTFIENELIPNISKNYRTSGENALLGHSLGGLFASFIMLENSPAFNKYMILSPTAINEIGIIEKISKMKKNNVKAYFAVGSLEFFKKDSMVKDLESFYQKLPNKKFTSKIEIIKDEDHISIFPIAFTKGVKYLFPTQNNKNN